MKRIDSLANPRYKALRRLATSSQERRKTGLSMLDGAHLVTAYRQQSGLPEQLVVSRSGLEDPKTRDIVEGMRGGEIVVLGDVLFGNLSSVATPTGIMAVVKTPSPQLIPQEMDACVMLEDLQDPGNLGSILRTCAAAGIQHVLLSAGSAHAWSPRVLRAGMGAHFALAIYEQASLETAAKAFRGRLIATRQDASQPVFAADLKGRVAFVFGNEGAGISPGLLGSADAVVSIPMPGRAESLNVAAATAVCLFERLRQLSAASAQPSASKTVP